MGAHIDSSSFSSVIINMCSSSLLDNYFKTLIKLDVNMLLSSYDDAGHQPAAVSAVPRACANHPPHKQHVSHDTLPSHSHAVILLSMNFKTAWHGFGLYHYWIFVCVPYFF